MRSVYSPGHHQVAGLNERQSLIAPKKPSQHFSGFSSEMGVAHAFSGYDMPRNVDPSVKKGVGSKQLV